MKKIPLSQGKDAIVDDDDYEYISRWKWCFSGKYAIRSEHGKTIWMHRVINCTPPGKITHHINGNKLDNRKSNLVTCTNQQNVHAKGPQPQNKTGYKGISISHGRFRAQIMINGEWRHIGYYRTAYEAAMAYDRLAEKYFKEFAFLNFNDDRQE